MLCWRLRKKSYPGSLLFSTIWSFQTEICEVDFFWSNYCKPIILLYVKRKTIKMLSDYLCLLSIHLKMCIRYSYIFPCTLSIEYCNLDHSRVQLSKRFTNSPNHLPDMRTNCIILTSAGF